MFDPEVAAALGDVEFSLDEIFSEAAARDKVQRTYHCDISKRYAANHPDRVKARRKIRTVREIESGEAAKYARDRLRNNPDAKKKNQDNARAWGRKYPERNRTRAAIWAAENPDRIMFRQYGITTFEYNSMLYVQDGVCKTCGRLNGDKRLVIDHCHSTGKVRGLLCDKCNMAAGLVGESASVLQALAEHVGGGGFGI